MGAAAPPPALQPRIFPPLVILFLPFFPLKRSIVGLYHKLHFYRETRNTQGLQGCHVLAHVYSKLSGWGLQPPPGSAAPDTLTPSSFFYIRNEILIGRQGILRGCGAELAKKKIII